MSFVNYEYRSGCACGTLPSQDRPGSFFEEVLVRNHGDVGLDGSESSQLVRAYVEPLPAFQEPAVNRDVGGGVFHSVCQFFTEESHVQKVGTEVVTDVEVAVPLEGLRRDGTARTPHQEAVVILREEVSCLECCPSLQLRELLDYSRHLSLCPACVEHAQVLLPRGEEGTAEDGRRLSQAAHRLSHQITTVLAGLIDSQREFSLTWAKRVVREEILEWHRILF